MPIAGCSVFSDSGSFAPGLHRGLAETQDKNAQAATNSKVANPPARTIRFDGHEIVLGDAQSSVLDIEPFTATLRPLIAQQRFRSAALLIQQHRETSERLLAERWALAADDPVVRLTADVITRRSSAGEANWNSLLQLAHTQSAPAKAYQEARNAFAKELQTSDPSNEKAAQLQQLAQAVGHPLVKIDSLRLLGLRELVAERTGWAESLCRQAVEVATASGNQLLAAELWLMVAEAARRSEQGPQAAEAWSTAVAMHLAALNKEQPIDVSFWLLAESVRPEASTWPSELVSALGPYLAPIGCSSDGGAEMVLWASVAQAQFERGEMQLALLNFKKAETLVSGDNALWLRIAQSKCLAAMGQVPAASAILSGPAASNSPAIAAAATAAMGSTKLEAGAYQQGAQLLNKALTEAGSSHWPTKDQALADLALAQLIIGETEPGLEALHGVQAQFAQAGSKTLLIRSLENELRLLQHEHRDAEASAVNARIAELERF